MGYHTSIFLGHGGGGVWGDRSLFTFDDFDYFEVHEAFAAQALCTFKAWESKDYCTKNIGLPDALGEIPRDKLNLAGGSVRPRSSICGHRGKNSLRCRKASS